MGPDLLPHLFDYDYDAQLPDGADGAGRDGMGGGDDGVGKPFERPSLGSRN